MGAADRVTLCRCVRRTSDQAQTVDYPPECMIDILRVFNFQSARLLGISPVVEGHALFYEYAL
jgi:hypothetical protein